MAQSDGTTSNHSPGSRKSFRRLVKRFAEKTSMQGVPYINNAKLWWAKLLWSILLVVAIGVMGLHLWYLFSQFYSYPKITKVELGFANLDFPEITICNTNQVHQGRLRTFDGADDLKELVDALQPENLVPDQFDPNYDPEADVYGQGIPPPTESATPPNRSPTGSRVTGRTRTTQAGGRTPTTGSPTSPSPPPPGKRRRKRFVDNLNAINTSKYLPNKPPPEELADDEYDGEITSEAEIQAVFNELYMDINKKNRKELGHQIEDMLIECTFNGRECKTNLFKLHQTSEYGNCWSIRSNQFIARSSGPQHGLRLTLYLEPSEYLKGITTGYGARLLLHRKNTYPTPADEGIFLSAAMETSIGIRMTSIQRKGEPYGKCEEGDVFQERYGYIYTISACQRFCYLTKLVEKCKCFDDEYEEAAVKRNGTLKPCRSVKEITCLRSLAKRFFENFEQCSCLTPCFETQWSKTISQRQWPTDEYAMVLLQDICEGQPAAVCKSLRKERTADTRSLNSNFLRLNIYYEELNYQSITEEAEIETAQFASDVGGAVGLWIGLSILSVCEVLQLLLELCDYGFNRALTAGGGESRADRQRRRVDGEQSRDKRMHKRSNNGTDHGHTHYDSDYNKDYDSDRSVSYISERPKRVPNSNGRAYKGLDSQWPYPGFRPGTDHSHSHPDNHRNHQRHHGRDYSDRYRK